MSLVATELEQEGALALAQARPALGEPLRYFVASLAALALDAGLLWVGARAFALPVWVAGAFSYAAGLVFIYLLSVRWVFTARTVADRKSEFAAFAALGVFGLVLNSATMFVATSIGIPLPFAKALSAGIGFVTNFVTRKILLFTTSRT